MNPNIPNLYKKKTKPLRRGCSDAYIVVTFEEEVIGKLKYDGKTKSLKQL